MKNIKSGDKNDEVKEVQELFKKLFYTVDVDGDFGNQTLGIVNEFQKYNSLPVTGIVDDATFNLLKADVDYTASVDKASVARIENLHPKVRAEILHLFKKCYKNGVKIRVVQGLRTFAEQDELYAQGRTKPGPIVTKARGGLSNHNYGCAIDFCLLHGDGTISWSNSEDFDKDGKKDWMEVVEIFKANGYEWGGDWKTLKDTPHLEKTFNMSIRTMLKLHNDGKVDANGYIII